MEMLIVIGLFAFAYWVYVGSGQKAKDDRREREKNAIHRYRLRQAQKAQKD